MSTKKLELHVWGRDGDISLIDPESRACAWLLFLHLTPLSTDFVVVTSCNTNLAETCKLPVLIVHDGNRTVKHEGFYAVVDFVSTLHPTESKFTPNDRLSSTEQLVNITLAKYIQNTFYYISQYNLYVNTRNYEQCTRKRFASLLPFPMYYNQPLSLQKDACEKVKILGLGSSSAGFFSFSGAPELELDDDDSAEINPVAISALHEKVMLAKGKNKVLLRESKMSFRCLLLLDGYVNHVMKLFKELNPDSPVEFAHLFRPNKISACELLLYAHLHSLTHSDLPDRFIYKYLSEKFPPFFRFSTSIMKALDSAITKSHFRAPQKDEIPSLWNEIKLWAAFPRPGSTTN